MLTVEEAIANAVRCLQQAEGETNLGLMDALTRLAEAWVSLATVLLEQ